MKKFYTLLTCAILFFSCTKDDVTTINPTAITSTTALSDTNTSNTTNTDNTTDQVYGDWTISHRTANGKEIDQTIWAICESRSTLTFKSTSKSDSNLCFTTKKTTSYTCAIYYCNNRDYSYDENNGELKFHAESLYITAKVLKLDSSTLQMSYSIDGIEYIDTYSKK